MAVTYTERIGEVCRYEHDENFVRSVVFQVYATEGEEIGLYEEIVRLDDKPLSGFVAYSELEKEEGEATLIGWAKTKLGDIGVNKCKRRAYRLIDTAERKIVNEVPSAWTTKPVATKTSSNLES
tara:strand:- start:353 stop:724 length:372 start_codon:yes stop_codon:yes gene_type:complete